MVFVKHIFIIFSQTAAQILMKFGSYMHLSKDTQVCSNQGCMTYFHRNQITEAMNWMDRTLCKKKLNLMRRHSFKCNCNISSIVDLEAFSKYAYVPLYSQFQ